MVFRLVQELEHHFRGMGECKKEMPIALELTKRIEEAQERGAARNGAKDKAKDIVKTIVKTIADTYAKSAQTIHGYLIVPIITAMCAWLADGLLGSLQWLHTPSLSHPSLVDRTYD